MAKGKGKAAIAAFKAKHGDKATVKGGRARKIEIGRSIRQKAKRETGSLKGFRGTTTTSGSTSGSTASKPRGRAALVALKSVGGSLKATKAAGQKRKDAVNVGRDIRRDRMAKGVNLKTGKGTQSARQKRVTARVTAKRGL